MALAWDEMKNSPASEWLFAGVPMIIGGVVLAYAIRNCRCAWRSRSWPRVTGTVLQSDVIEKPTGKRSSMLYQPVIAYTYEVAGIAYQSDQLGFGFYDFLGDGLFRSRAEAEKFAASYRPGNPVSVAYDPEDNFRAVLKTGINKGHVATLLLGFLCLGLGFGCLWSFLSK